VVLTGDAAKAFDALNADGKLDLSTVGAQLKELAELRSTRGKESRQAALTLAAGDKYKVKVLQKVLGETPLEFKKVLQRKEDGEEGMEEVSLPYVKVGDTLEPLDAWLEREHEDFMDIIMVEDRDDSADEDKPSKKPKDKEEIPASRMPRQTPSGGGDRSSGGKKGDKDIMKQVDKTLSIHMTPAQRRKADAAASV
jgi:hypothetical protein